MVLNLKRIMFIVSLLLCIPLYAGVKSFTLEECIEIALQNHPDIKISQEDKKQANAGYYMVKSEKNIHVSATASTVRTTDDGEDMSVDNPFKGSDFGVRAGFSFGYRLVAPGYDDKIEAARKAVDVAKLQEKKKTDSVVLGVKNAYYTYMNARHVAELREQIKKNYKARLETIKILVQNGERPILDLSMGEVSYAQAALDSDKAETYELSMKSELLAAMGIMDDDVAIELKDIELWPDLRFNLEDLHKLAQSYCPDIQLAQMDKETKRINIDIAKSERYSPIVDFTLFTGYENSKLAGRDEYQDNFKGSNWSPYVAPTITARIPLYSGGAISANVDSKISEYKKSIYRERKIVLAIRKTIKNYYQRMSELKEQMKISWLNIVNARTNLKLAQKSYENGIGSQLLIQNAEESVLKAEMSLLDARYEYLSILARLANLIGIGEDFLCEK